ncbi:MAG: hypothetical protein HFJ55_06420 [Clostridia bacterium]|jgi:hypothetical protein|nr:hypothetical protein [Clostridia bacterium]
MSTPKKEQTTSRTKAAMKRAEEARMERARIVARYLFKNVSKSLKEEYAVILASYIQAQNAELGCCVLWSRSDDFLKFLREHNMPSIGKKEIIISDESVRGCPDWTDHSVSFIELNPNFRP